jgi:hypothetical protein
VADKAASLEKMRSILQDYRPDLPEAVVGLVAQALSVVSASRPSVEAMLAGLAPFVATPPTVALPSPPKGVGVHKLVAQETVRNLSESLEQSALGAVPEANVPPSMAEVAATPAATVVPADAEPEVPMSERQEFLEDVVWHLKSRPVLLGTLVVVALGLGSMWLHYALRPSMATSPPLLSVKHGHLVQRIPRAGSTQADWNQVQTVTEGGVYAADRGPVDLLFDHSAMTLSDGTRVTCLGRPHDSLALQLEAGQINVQAEDPATIRLLPGNEVHVSSGTTLLVDVTGQSGKYLLLHLAKGNGSVSVGRKMVTLPVGKDERISLDGKKTL